MMTAWEFSLLEAGLFQDAVPGGCGEVLAEFTSDGHLAGFGRMSVLTVAAPGGDETPAVAFNGTYGFADLVGLWLSPLTPPKRRPTGPPQGRMRQRRGRAAGKPARGKGVTDGPWAERSGLAASCAGPRGWRRRRRVELSLARVVLPPVDSAHGRGLPESQEQWDLRAGTVNRAETRLRRASMCAECREDAEAEIERFAEDYGGQFPKAVESLQRNQDYVPDAPSPSRPKSRLSGLAIV